MDNSRCIVVDSTGLFDCGAGLTITNSKALSLSATRVAGCLAGFRLENSIGSTVSGCFVGRHVTSGPSARSPLEIVGGSALTISGFQSEMTGAGAGSPPHVLVTGGATEVMFTSIRRINGTTAPAVELDVAGAGGRVLFAQQNFDPARINSGGKFVAL